MKATQFEKKIRNGYYLVHDDMPSRIKEFEQDVINAVGLSDHPKANQAFDKAFEEYHCEGLWSVYQELLLLANLML